MLEDINDKINELKAENEKLKEEIEQLKVSINCEEEEEDLQMVMFEGKEYYVDISAGLPITFEEDTENIVKDVVNDIIDEVLDKSLP